MVINPNYEVAESDFTNNAMKCNCKYDGHRIWVHSCHIGTVVAAPAPAPWEWPKGGMGEDHGSLPPHLVLQVMR